MATTYRVAYVRILGSQVIAGRLLQTVGGSQALLHIACAESYRHVVGVEFEKIRTGIGPI